MDDDRYEYVLEALGVISRLTENKRLSIRSGHVDIDNDRKFQFIKRWWTGDDREVCLNKVKQIFNEGIHMARAALQDIIVSTGANNQPSHGGVSMYLEKERSVRKYGRLSEALEGASHGIETHKVTYKNDDRFCALVDVLVGHVRDQLHDMDMTLKVTSSTGATVGAIQREVVSSTPPSFHDDYVVGDTPPPRLPSPPPLHDAAVHNYR